MFLVLQERGPSTVLGVTLCHAVSYFHLEVKGGPVYMNPKHFLHATICFKTFFEAFLNFFHRSSKFFSNKFSSHVRLGERKTH